MLVEEDSVVHATSLVVELAALCTSNDRCANFTVLGWARQYQSSWVEFFPSRVFVELLGSVFPQTMLVLLGSDL